MADDDPDTGSSAEPRSKSTAATQAFYGRWARLYDLIARRTPGIGRLRRRTVAACRLDAGDTAVEMGCGTGANLPYLREAVGSEGTVIGVDVTGPVLERARSRMSAFDNVHLIRADATSPPVPDERVDAVLATFVVGMLEAPAAAVDRWCDLVGPGGRVVLANAARSDAWYVPVVNPAFRAVVVCSTPPTLQVRYESDPTATLDDRVARAHDRLRARSSAVADERHWFDVVRLTGGRIR